MKDWKEVDKKGNGGLTGSKYPIDAILNREIHLQAAKVEPSKRNDGNCLTTSARRAGLVRTCPL